MTKITFVEPDGNEKVVDAQNGLSLLEVAHNNGISLKEPVRDLWLAHLSCNS